MTFLPVLALAAGLLAVTPADAATINDAKVTAVFAQAVGSNAFGPYVQVTVRFSKSFGSGCPNQNTDAIYRVYQGSQSRDVDLVALETIRQTALSALLGSRTVTVVTNSCHDGWHALSSLNLS